MYQWATAAWCACKCATCAEVFSPCHLVFSCVGCRHAAFSSLLSVCVLYLLLTPHLILKLFFLSWPACTLHRKNNSFNTILPRISFIIDQTLWATVCPAIGVSYVTDLLLILLRIWSTFHSVLQALVCDRLCHFLILRFQNNLRLLCREAPRCLCFTLQEILFVVWRCYWMLLCRSCLYPIQMLGSAYLRLVRCPYAPLSSQLCWKENTLCHVLSCGRFCFQIPLFFY